MTRIELYEAVAAATGCGIVTAEDVVKATFDVITETLADGEDIVLTGFGTFKVGEIAARDGRNPKTGESIKIPASKIARFKMGAYLKRAINQ